MLSDRGLLERTGDDVDFGAHADRIEKIDDIARAHADAAVAGGSPDAPLRRSAVDVDGAIVREAILRLEAFQPEDARDDGVTARSIDLDDLAGRTAALEFHPDRLSGADFLGDFQSAEWRAAATRTVTDAEF